MSKVKLFRNKSEDRAVVIYNDVQYPFANVGNIFVDQVLTDVHYRKVLIGNVKAEFFTGFTGLYNLESGNWEELELPGGLSLVKG